MTISYVGGQVAGRAGIASTASITFALTGGYDTTPRAGDLVIITAVVGSAGRNQAQAITGYTALGQLNPNTQTNDTSMDVSWKVMGTTPDTTFTLPSTGNVADAQRYSIQVFRGVDQTTPMDVAAVAASGVGTGRPDPASITPVTTGAWVVICGGGSAATGANYVAPANFTTGFLTGFTADTTDAMVGSGYWSGWTSGAVDPAAYTGGTANAVDSWAAYTIAIRPENMGNTPVFVSVGARDSGVGVSLIALPAGWAQGDYLVALIQTANETGAIDAGWPGWSLIGSTGVAGAAPPVASAGLHLYGKFAGASETVPDTTDSGDHQLTAMMAFRGVDTVTPVELVVSGNGGAATAVTALTLTSPGTTLGTNRLIAGFVTSGLDSASTTTYSAWANSGLSDLRERVDDGTVAGAGGTFGAFTGRKATAGAVGATNATQTSATAAWITIAIKPVASEVSPFSRSISEPITLADAQTTSAIFKASQTDALTLSDSETGAAVFQSAQSDAVTLGDSSDSTKVSGVVTHTGDVTEALTLGDSETVTATFKASQSDALTLSDSETGAAVFQSAQSDALTLSDSETTNATFKASQSDALTLVDLADFTGSLSVIATDALSLGELASASLVSGVVVVESMTLSDGDSAFASFVALVAESLTLSDIRDAARQYSSSNTEPLTLSDLSAAAHVSSASVAEPLTLSDFCDLYTLVASVVEPLTLSDIRDAARQYSSSRTDSIALFDTTTAMYFVPPAGVQAGRGPVHSARPASTSDNRPRDDNPSRPPSVVGGRPSQSRTYRPRS